MKKAIITALTVSCLVGGAYAQGTISFANSASTLISNITTLAPVVVGTTFRVALYYAPDAPEAPPDSAFFQIGASGTIAPSPGRFNAGTRTAPTATPGGPGWFQVRAWESAFGATFEEALVAPAQGGRLALAGTSNKFYLPSTGNPPLTPAASITGANQLQAFFVVPVPEPSVIGLGLLGLGALFLIRRRQ